MKVEAEDGDAPSSRRENLFRYVIEKGDPQSFFVIDENTGWFSLRKVAEISDWCEKKKKKYLYTRFKSEFYTCLKVESTNSKKHETFLVKFLVISNTFNKLKFWKEI